MPSDTTELEKRKAALWERWGDGLGRWGLNTPAGWSDAVRLAQIDAALIPDGLWGPACNAAGIPKPPEGTD